MSTSLCGTTLFSSDIAGLSLRASTYVLALLAVRAVAVFPASGQIYRQAFPFVLVNIAVLASALFFGCSPSPEINLQDCLDFHYLGTPIPAPGGDSTVSLSSKCRSHYQNLQAELGVRGSSFVISEGCDEVAIKLMVRAFSVSHGWVFSAAILCAIIHCSTLFQTPTLSSTGEINTAEEGKHAKVQGGQESIKADYGWGVQASILLAILVLLTETMIARDSIAPQEGSLWKYGQIFPLILMAVPLSVPKLRARDIKAHQQEINAPGLEEKNLSERTSIYRRCSFEIYALS
ncbi:hypothetical protein CPB83DRAFT_907550 [Crepidotus variabilis]|uniref:Uncharacterized protein n=1 Tax=Crepidotus variabilis TaxID=179855 RepID=A0A9P6EEL7_9AGAR|nr:hypothetical protein CPB83DRAFT_907550 [Crepidotus variabilis]